MVRFGLAERTDLAGLEEAEQLRLRLGAHLADFVEEQRPAGGGANDAEAFLVRAGEGTAPMAEQLAIDHVLRHGGAVEGQEGAVLARGSQMQRPREQLLADAGLAGNEDGEVRWRDAANGFDQIEHALG